MSPIIPSRYGHPKYNIFPQKTRAASLGGFKASQRGTPNSDSKSRRKQRLEESKITVQSAEDEDGDNFFSKHLAAARFQRNHRLINVLFSEVVVDQEQPSDTDKFQACKKRVKSLTEYQKKIDDEIVELNEKFKAKKIKIVEEGKRFADKLNDFIATSRKELDTLRAAQEVRRQELNNKQQQADILALKSQTVNSITTNIPSEKSDTSGFQKEIPMDISTGEDFNHANEIRLVLDSVLQSITDIP